MVRPFTCIKPQREDYVLHKMLDSFPSLYIPRTPAISNLSYITPRSAFSNILLPFLGILSQDDGVSRSLVSSESETKSVAVETLAFLASVFASLVHRGTAEVGSVCQRRAHSRLIFGDSRRSKSVFSVVLRGASGDTSIEGSTRLLLEAVPTRVCEDV